MIEIQDNSNQAEGYGTWEFDITANGFWLTVPTAHGYVLAYVYIHPGGVSKDMTVLRFIAAGRLHTRHIFGKAYSKRFCTTLAKRYAQEIVDHE